MPFAAHQPLDPAAADLLAGPQRAPSTSAGSRRRSSWRACSSRIRPSSRSSSTPAGRAPAAGALVVGGRRHAQGPADRLDPEALAMLVDERAHFGRCGSSSPAKNTDAAFKISFARRSSKISRRSFRISSRSSAASADPAGDPRSPRPGARTCAASRTATRDQPRRARSDDPTRTPAASHAPTAPPGTSSLSASQTSFRQGRHPGIEVSVKPGMAQLDVGEPGVVVDDRVRVVVADPCFGPHPVA